MSRLERMLGPAACALLVGLALGQADRVQAATFSVNPTQVFLSAKVSTALVSLRNESDETLRFQLTLYAWDQASNGELKLAPTEEIVFFPRLLSLAPREERKVRVGTTTPPGATERTYRLFVEELPPTESEAPAGAVRVLTKMGIPIFVQPGSPVSRAELREVSRAGGKVTFTLANTGNAHFVPDAIRVQALAGDGRVLFNQAVNGWYVLAGGTRVFEVEVPKDVESEAKAFLVEVQVAGSVLKQRLEASREVSK